jgi:hypothetical protein
VSGQTTPAVVPADAALLRDIALGLDSIPQREPVRTVENYRADVLRALAAAIEKIGADLVEDVRLAGLASAFVASFMPLSSVKWNEARALNQRCKARVEALRALLPPE